MGIDEMLDKARMIRKRNERIALENRVGLDFLKMAIEIQICPDRTFEQAVNALAEKVQASPTTARHKKFQWNLLLLAALEVYEEVEADHAEADGR